MVLPKSVYLSISKLYFIFAVANFLAHNVIGNHKLLCASKFAWVKIECSFEMGKENTFRGTTYSAFDGTLVRYQAI